LGLSKLVTWAAAMKAWVLDRSPSQKGPPHTGRTSLSVWLQKIILVVIVGIDRRADIADWDRECALPAGPLSSRVPPLSFEGGSYTIGCCSTAVIIGSYVVGVQRRVDDILNSIHQCQ